MPEPAHLIFPDVIHQEDTSQLWHVEIGATPVSEYWQWFDWVGEVNISAFEQLVGAMWGCLRNVKWCDAARCPAHQDQDRGWDGPQEETKVADKLQMCQSEIGKIHLKRYNKFNISWKQFVLPTTSG